MGSHRVWYEATDPPGQASSSGPEGVVASVHICQERHTYLGIVWDVLALYWLWIRLLHHPGGGGRGLMVAASDSRRVP